ncbi:helix-turn-helix domain-containing protein [Clostridium saccharoperbutylacetonicum]
MKRKSSEEIRSKAVKLYEEGSSAMTIANKLGYNEATVRGWLKRYGIIMRDGSFYNRKYDEKIVINIEQLYSHGKYTTEIDEFLGLRRGTSQYILNKNNIELRHRGPKSKIQREDFFDNIDCEEKAYFLGYIMADGNVSVNDNQYRLKFHISIKDKEIVDKFLKVINCSNKTSIRYKTESYYVSLTSVHMCKRLIELGVLPCKTGKECIPENIPADLVHHYLRGVFDGDGITDISKKRSGFVGSVTMIYSILKELNEKLTVFEAGKNKKVVYFLGGKKFSRKLYDYLYYEATIWLERKRSRLEYIYS